MSSNFIRLGQQRSISLWTPEFEKELGEYEYLLHLPEFSPILGGRKTQLVGIIDNSQPLILLSDSKVLGVFSTQIKNIGFVPVRVAESYAHLKTISEKLQLIWGSSTQILLEKNGKTSAAYQKFAAELSKYPKTSAMFWKNYAFPNF
jgi:hypothetical protein